MSIEPRDTLAQEIASLDSLNLDELRRRWQAISGRTAPKHLSRLLLSRLCAYRLQADAYGDLSAGVSQLLDRLGSASPTDKRPVPLPATPGGNPQLKPGTLLVPPAKISVIPPILPIRDRMVLPRTCAPQHDPRVGTKRDDGAFVHQLANPVLQIGFSAHAQLLF
jgi:hypothetical protein